MKKPIQFTTHQEQRQSREYWLSRSPEERLAELFRLRRKAFWEYYKDGELKKSTYFKMYTIQATETLEEFFARVEREKKAEEN